MDYERFVAILAEEIMADIDWITPEALLVEELGLQSIDVVQIVERVEQEVGHPIEGLDMDEVETVEEFYWELINGGDDGGDSIVAARAEHASSLEGLVHEMALRRYMPHDINADVTTLVGMLARRAAVTPDAPAIVFDGETTTYRQLGRSIAHMAGALQKHGVEQGDRVAIVMPNHPAFFAVFYGVQHLRATAVPIFHASQPARVAAIARQCGAKAIVTARPLVRPVRKRLEAALGDDRPLILDVPSLTTEPVHRAEPLPTPEPDDLAMLQYTSGTTGDSKGVMLTQRALLANLRQMIVGGGMPEDEVVVTWLPVYHDMGLIAMTMCPFYLGSKVVLLPVSLKPQAWLQAIQDHRATLTAAPDFAYRFALRFGGNLDRYDLSSLQYGLIAAEPIRARTVARFEAALGIPGALRPGYGLAEACVGVTSYPRGRTIPIKTDADGIVACGPALPGTRIVVRDEDGVDLPVGAVGELCFTSPSQTLGYYRNPEATAALFTADGFVRTGDMGKLDDDGNVYVVARAKDVIIVAGRNLSPKELEELAESVPGVGIAMALGLDSGSDSGEQVHLVLEPDGRAPADEATAAELRRGVSRAVTRHLGIRPEAVHVVPPRGIPRTYNGKLQYRVMRDQLLAARAGV